MHHRSPLTTLAFYDKRKREEHLSNLRIPKRWKKSENLMAATEEEVVEGEEEEGGLLNDAHSLGLTSLGAEQEKRWIIVS